MMLFLDRLKLLHWTTAATFSGRVSDVFLLPVGDNAGVVGHIVLVYQWVRVVYKPLLHVVSTDWTRPCHRLTEVSVDRRPSDRLDSLQLTRSGDIEPLKEDTQIV